MKKLLVIILLSTSTLFIYAEEVPANRESIKKLIEMKESPNYFSNLSKRLVATITAFNLQITNNTQREINRLVSEKQLENRIVELYQNNYSQEEIEALLEFYSTDIGQKILKSEKSMRDEIEINIQKEIMKVVQVGLAEYYLKNLQ